MGIPNILGCQIICDTGKRPATTTGVSSSCKRSRGAVEKRERRRVCIRSVLSTDIM